MELRLKENLVSVIMPVYNSAAYLKQSINSILSQTYENIELLIVDDGSKDSSWRIISEIKDERLKKFKFDKNRGNIIALNFLLEMAVGNFITFQDSDDWSDINRIEIQVDFFKNNSQIYLCGTEYKYVEIDGILTQSNILPLTNNGIIDYITNFEIPPFCAASCMIRHEVYDKIGGFREYFNRIGAGDFDWHYRIIENFQVANIDKILYFYRKNNLSLTSTVCVDVRKMVSEKIAYFLYKQRQAKAFDALDIQNFAEIDEYTKMLLPQYFKDKGLIYFRAAENEIKANQLFKGFITTIGCVIRKPFKRRNLTLIKLLVKKSLNLFLK